MPTGTLKTLVRTPISMPTLEEHTRPTSMDYAVRPKALNTPTFGVTPPNLHGPRSACRGFLWKHTPL